MVTIALPAPGLAEEDRDGPPLRIEEALDRFSVAWWAGDAPRAEAWLGRVRPVDAPELIYREYCLAEADRLEPSRVDYLARFSGHREALNLLFALHDLAPPGVFDIVEPMLPEAGDEIGPYLLVRELGRGSFARVFLAEQRDLASRLVVLKVTTRPSPEPSLLARARHAHIVEVFRAAEADDGALQLVCMAFMGGATLAEVSGAGSLRPRTGAEFLARLDAVSAPEYPEAKVPRPAREILARLSHPKAVAWMFARLAEALDHAFRRGVVHGDLKPSNILITADALPMLFDFNLSVDWRAGPDAADAPTTGGGTLAYMPPERLAAIAEARSDRGRARGASGNGPDAHRADVYSLALVLVEALTGVAPAAIRPEDIGPGPAAIPQALARARAGGTTAFPDWRGLPIPSGLRPILAHALAADPSKRHPDGRSLAADLDRWRSDLPPLTASDGPWSSRVSRWAARRRKALIATALTVIAAAITTGIVSTAYRSTLRDEAHGKYAEWLTKEDPGHFAFRQFGAWTRGRDDPADIAARKLRYYNVLDDPSWRSRPDVSALADPDRSDLELLVLEQVYRAASGWADRPDSPEDWRRALSLLDRESRLVPVSAFASLRETLRSRLGEASAPPPSPASAPPPGSWIEDYLAGVALEARSARQALVHFERATEARPDLLWPHFRAASTAYRLGWYETSIRHLRRANARHPDSPAILTHLAASLFLYKQTDEALEAADRAIALNPDHAQAFFNRSLAGALPAGRDAGRFAVLTRYRGQAALETLDLQHLRFRGMISRQDEDGDATAEIIRKILAVDPTNPDARTLEARQLYNSGQFEPALKEFDAILRDDPEHLRTLYNRASVLRTMKHPEAAEVCASLIRDPRFEELYREEPAALFVLHGVVDDLLASGRLDEALAVAERSLKDARHLKRYVAPSAYWVARVHASAARSDPRRLDSARARLRLAFELCPGLRDDYKNDPHFDSLRRSDPEFHRPDPLIDPAVSPIR